MESKWSTRSGCQIYGLVSLSTYRPPDSGGGNVYKGQSVVMCDKRVVQLKLARSRRVASILYRDEAPINVCAIENVITSKILVI